MLITYLAAPVMTTSRSRTASRRPEARGPMSAVQ